MCHDFKGISLQLYGKEVEIIFKEDSPSYKVYYGKLTGTLIGRTWGDRLVNHHKVETVIALTIDTESGEKEIFCNHIQELKEAEQKLNLSA